MMRFLFFFLLVFQSTFSHSQVAENYQGWKLIFADQFDTLDPRKWNVENDKDGFALNRPETSFNRSLVRTARPENVHCEKGSLVITVRHEIYSCPEEKRSIYGCSVEGVTGKPYTYTSGLVEQAIPYRFGLVEARVKISDAPGLNSAFWLLNGSEPYQEVDIFEMTPGAKTDGCPHIHDKGISTSNWHYIGGVALSSEGKTSLSSVDDYTQYHNYAVEWTPTRLIYYIDGKVVRNTLHEEKITRPLNIIFSIGFSDFLKPDTSDFPVSMYIDWVKAYQREDLCIVDIDTCNFEFPKTGYYTWKKFSLGGDGCVNSILPGSNIAIKAADGIELEGDLTFPAGAEVLLDSDHCY